MLNLLVHRDYSFSASAIINIYRDRIEFVSIGGLVPGIELEDIMAGISVCRNQDLANVFYRLHLIEAYGTGMGKIMKAYENLAEKPIIETTKNTFKIILPNVNAKHEYEYEYKNRNRNNYNIIAEPQVVYSVKSKKKLSDAEERILEYARIYGAVTRKDAIRLLGVSTSTASRVIQKMVKNKLLMQNGKARNTHYTIINH